jgi:hypothetical protein
MVKALSDLIRRRGGLYMIIRAHRFVAAGAFAVAAVAAPIAVALMGVDTASNAAPKCLSQVTSNGSDPICVGYSNGQPLVGSSPGGLYGPGQGIGVNTGPLAPGTTWSTPVN